MLVLYPLLIIGAPYLYLFIVHKKQNFEDKKISKILMERSKLDSIWKKSKIKDYIKKKVIELKKIEGFTNVYVKYITFVNITKDEFTVYIGTRVKREKTKLLLEYWTFKRVGANWQIVNKEKSKHTKIGITILVIFLLAPFVFVLLTALVLFFVRNYI